MKFNDLDAKMRVYETNTDQHILPGMHIVVRLDGRGFTKLTKETLDFEKPFDPRFRDAMKETVKHLMNCGFNIIYGYTQSDEISLLFHPQDASFHRKLRKILSVLSGEASAKFSLEMKHIGVFDSRISPMPKNKLVEDYFRWRAEDAHRNSLSAYCYWKLRETGKTKSQATREIEKLGVSAKNELLYSMGINYNDLPAWQKRGMGFYYKDIQREALNPKTGEKVIAKRKELFVDEELPVGEAYTAFIKEILDKYNDEE